MEEEGSYCLEAMLNAIIAADIKDERDLFDDDMPSVVQPRTPHGVYKG